MSHKNPFSIGDMVRTRAGAVFSDNTTFISDWDFPVNSLGRVIKVGAFTVTVEFSNGKHLHNYGFRWFNPLSALELLALEAV